jgi:hypothetical protein
MCFLDTLVIAYHGPIGSFTSFGHLWGYLPNTPHAVRRMRGYTKNPTLVLSMYVLDVVIPRDYSATAAKCAAFLRRQAMVMSVSITSPNTA